MRTLAMTAALVTALTGTGCIVSSTDPVQVGDVDLRWRFQSTNDFAGNWSQADTGCSKAAISTVDGDVQLTVWDSFNRVVVNHGYPCRDAQGFPGVYLQSLPVGHYTYAVDAYRSGSPAFHDEWSFDVLANQVTLEQSTMVVLATAPLTVYFTQNGAFTCGGTPDIRFDLYGPGSVFIESTTVPCTSAYGFTATADHLTGLDYSLDLFALNGVLPPAGPASVNERCLQTVRHTGFPVTIDLLPSPQANCSF